MKFKFGYERLLEYHNQQERIAQRDYNDSLNRLDHEKQVYKQMYEDLDRAADEGFNIQSENKIDAIEKIKNINQFIEGQRIRILRQREIIINYNQIVDQKQEVLIAATKQRQIFEKLKERRFLEFSKQEKKKEYKTNDELVVTRFQRGRT